MENSTNVMGSHGLATEYIEDMLQYLPDNPLTDPMAKTWMWMTDSYTKFQIATWGSLIVHEVIYSYR